MYLRTGRQLQLRRSESLADAPSRDRVWPKPIEVAGRLISINSKIV